MSKSFAVIVDKIVVNTIVAETQEIAEMVTEKNCVEYNKTKFVDIGYSYDPIRNAFIPPKPFESWALDEATCQWEAPTPMPTDDKLYTWDEPSLTWLEIQQP